MKYLLGLLLVVLSTSLLAERKYYQPSTTINNIVNVYDERCNGSSSAAAMGLHQFDASTDRAQAALAFAHHDDCSAVSFSAARLVDDNLFVNVAISGEEEGNEPTFGINFTWKFK